ncbi:DapH/DapD/GlmU-related protein [Limosilactobacillus caecicola]|uniref:DapH/DapD/GlmU-related protein n=1 Tax=Limosilactobacillus caecicola TaxID=2941332 RepID=UPI00203F0CD5|nr:DapH/DapD/GlmU-related protein [Limosilactobacillus caecicola]
MSVFEQIRNGQAYNIKDEDYQREVHGEINRSRDLNFLINQTRPSDTEQLNKLEEQLLTAGKPEGTFLTPPFQIDCASRLFLGKNVFANHGLTVMSLGSITIDDGVMMGPEVALLTVNHEPKNIRVVKAAEIHIKSNAWIGARAIILPGVTIGENAIVGSGAVVTHDVPDNAVVVGSPARVIKTLD